MNRLDTHRHPAWHGHGDRAVSYARRSSLVSPGPADLHAQRSVLGADAASLCWARLRGKTSALAEAIRYALGRWEALSLFLNDGRIDLDNNPVERAIRPVALGRKNHLFAGSDGGGARWAVVSSLVETAKMNGVEPFAYLRDVLERMVDGHPVNRLDELLPWAWKAENVPPWRS